MFGTTGAIFDAGISHFGTTGIKIWHQPAGVAPLVPVV
jgi:hypothetical protein